MRRYERQKRGAVVRVLKGKERRCLGGSGNRNIECVKKKIINRIFIKKIKVYIK